MHHMSTMERVFVWLTVLSFIALIVSVLSLVIGPYYGR
jgi:hypothetical protein